MLIPLVFEDTKIEQEIYQAINSSFTRRIKFRPSKYLSQLNCKKLLHQNLSRLKRGDEFQFNNQAF